MGQVNKAKKILLDGEVEGIAVFQVCGDCCRGVSNEVGNLVRWAFGRKKSLKISRHWGEG